MKDYIDVAQEILLRRDQYVTNRKKQIKGAFALLTCLYLIALLGVGISTIDPIAADQKIINQQTLHTVHTNIKSGQTIGTEQAPSFQLPAANFNSATLSGNFTGDIALMLSDFKAMSYEEMLAYYGISLSMDSIFPDLCRDVSQNPFGIYENSTRGIYYDKNVISFVNQNQTVRLDIAFSKAAHRPDNSISLAGTALAFTEINRHSLALFQYVDDVGAVNYYVELLQNEIGWYVTGIGMTEDDFLQILLTLISPANDTEAEKTQTITGTISSIDPHRGIITIQTDGYGNGYQIRLSDSIASANYLSGDRITVTYTGEPATIQTIWSQQLICMERTFN